MAEQQTIRLQLRLHASLFARSGKCRFDRPSLFKTIFQGMWRKLYFSSPLGNSHRSPVERDFLGTSHVSVLFSDCCPSTVSRFVMSVVVDAVNLMLGSWATSHVGKKINKGFSPSFAHFNPATTVVLIASVLWVCASLHEMRPDAVFGRIVKSVFDGPAPKTSTRLCGSAPEVGEADLFGATAIAFTEPMSPVRIRPNVSDDSKQTEFLPNDVLYVGRESCNTCASHVRLLNRRAWLEAAGVTAPCGFANYRLPGVEDAIHA